ncbi:MAG: IS1182 family transposase, partial [Spirochaetes bacterium]|nr:IS1182 family transposase [Spirochaetota bacterium]
MELIPVSFDEQIIPGTFEHTLSFLIDHKLDLSIFEEKYNNDSTGAPAYNPKIMLKIILYCYSRGVFSSRDIEYYCRTNIIVKALSANTVPHFTSIADFVSSMKKEIYPVFLNILMVCDEMGLIGGEMFALDGCKFSSNASKEWSGTFKELRKKKEKIEKLVKAMVLEHEARDQDGGQPTEEKEKNEIRMRRLTKKADKIEKFLKTEQPKKASRSGEKQSNITDNESAKIKSSHGVIQGYNGLSVVDSKHQIVVYPEAFGSGHEGEFLKGMVRKTKAVMSANLKDKIITADTNYFSEKNLKYLAQNGQKAVIPDTGFRKRDGRFETADRHKPVKKNQFGIEDFEFDAERNVYICKKGEEIPFRNFYELKKITYGKYICRLSACRGCEYRQQCLRNDKTKYRTISRPIHAENRNYSNDMKVFIDTPEGRKLYAQRMRIVEPVFGNIRACKGMDRFTLRGKVKVNNQWVLMNMVHNIGKIQVFGGDLMK